MTNTSPESPARAPEGQERIGENEARAALRRNRAENLPKNPRDAERWQAGQTRDYDLYVSAVEQIPHSGQLLQKRLEQEEKKSRMPHLVQRQREVAAVIGAYLQNLKVDPLRESFSAHPDPKVNSLFKGYLSRVDGMLNQAQREGLVIVYGGRLTNMVAYADTWIRELTNILEGEMDPVTRQRKNAAFLTPQQKQYLQKVRSFFQAVMDGDPAYAQVQRAIADKPPQSEAMRKGMGALKLLGIAAAAGMALLSGLLDIKNGRLSPYTLAWLGLTGWSLGYFKGRDAVVMQQLQFVRTAEWERLCKDLNLKGKAGGELLLTLHRAHQHGKKSQAIAKLLKDNRQQGALDRDAYIKILCGENPQGNDAQIAAKLKNVSPQQLFFLARSLYGVTDPTAFALLSGFVESNTNSQTVTPELTEVRRLNSPSASAPSGTPQGNPPPKPGTSTQP